MARRTGQLNAFTLADRVEAQSDHTVSGQQGGDRLIHLVGLAVV